MVAEHPSATQGPCTGLRPQKEHAMHRTACLVLSIVGLVCWLAVSQSWGGPPNPTPSDANGNTAGGTNALVHTTTGSANTAFGFQALTTLTMGVHNTAVGNDA